MTDNRERLKTHMKIFDHLCYIFSELNSTFSVPVLVLLVTRFFTLITSSFACLLSITSSNSDLTNSSLLMLYSATVDWLRILIILSTSDIPIKQVITASFSSILFCSCNTFFRYTPTLGPTSSRTSANVVAF